MQQAAGQRSCMEVAMGRRVLREGSVKAVVIHAIGGPEQLVLADMPDPVPGAGEVVIDVAYSGCNWADTQVRQGIYPHAMTYPMVLGFEVAGMVSKLGAGVTSVKVGDRVATFPEKGGGYAEKCLAGAVGLIKLPDAVRFDVGAAFPIQALTAWHMLFNVHGRLKRGDTVLVNAIGGGVGLMVTQLAVHAGFTVIGTTGTVGKGEAAAGARRVARRQHRHRGFREGGARLHRRQGRRSRDRFLWRYHARPHLRRDPHDGPRDLDRRGRGPALQEPPRAHPAALADFYPATPRACRPELTGLARRRRALPRGRERGLAEGADRRCLSARRGG